MPPPGCFIKQSVTRGKVELRLEHSVGFDQASSQLLARPFFVTFDWQQTPQATGTYCRKTLQKTPLRKHLDVECDDEGEGVIVGERGRAAHTVAPRDDGAAALVHRRLRRNKTNANFHILHVQTRSIQACRSNTNEPGTKTIL